MMVINLRMPARLNAVQTGANKEMCKCPVLMVDVK